MLLWQPSPFIVPVVSQLWFTVMDRTLKGVTGFDAVSIIESFCSLILMKPENQVLKNTLPKWLSTALAFGIPQEC